MCNWHRAKEKAPVALGRHEELCAPGSAQGGEQRPDEVVRRAHHLNTLCHKGRAQRSCSSQAMPVSVTTNAPGFVPTVTCLT